MAHFVELDEQGVVLRVIVVNDEDTAVEDGTEVEELGVAFCHDLLGGDWLQTSYNNNIRRRYAGIGYTYDSQRNAFISPQQFESWHLDSVGDWQPPVAKPEDTFDSALSINTFYYWDEEKLAWIAQKANTKVLGKNHGPE